MLRPGQVRVSLQELLCGLLGLGQKPGIPGQIRHSQLGQAVLPGAEEIAGSPELQVLLGNLKAVRGARQGLEPGPALRIAGAGD